MQQLSQPLTLSVDGLTDDHVRLIGDDAIRQDQAALADAACAAFSWRRRDLDDVAWYAARQVCVDAWNACVAELAKSDDGTAKLAELRDQLTTVIAERLELELIALLAKRSDHQDPGIDAWVAYDPAGRSWRVTGVVRHIPCGERALGIHMEDDLLGIELRGRILRTMADLSC